LEVLPLLHRGSVNNSLLSLLESVTSERHSDSNNGEDYPFSHTFSFAHVSPSSSLSNNSEASSPQNDDVSSPSPQPSISESTSSYPTRTIYVVYRAYHPSHDTTSSQDEEDSLPLDRFRQYLRVMFVLESLSSEDLSFDRLLNRLMELHQPRGPPPTSKEFLDNLPEVEMDESLMEDCGSCSVCFDDFESGSLANQLPCKHLFHKDCITPWLIQHNTCPVCRHSLPTEEEEETSKNEALNYNDEASTSSSSSSSGPSSLPLDVESSEN